MTEKLLVGLMAVGVIFLGFIAFGGHAAPAGGSLGGTINYSNSLGQTNLYTTLASMLTDITNGRNSGGQTAWDSYSSSTFNFTSLVTNGGNATSTLTSSTAGYYLAGSIGEPSIGDLCLVGTNATATIVKGVAFTCQVTATGTLTIQANQASTGTVTLWPGGNVFVSAEVIHRGGQIATTTFLIPPAFVTTTSTSN